MITDILWLGIYKRLKIPLLRQSNNTNRNLEKAYEWLSSKVRLRFKCMLSVHLEKLLLQMYAVSATLRKIWEGSIQVPICSIQLNLLSCPNCYTSRQEQKSFLLVDQPQPQHHSKHQNSTWAWIKSIKHDCQYLQVRSLSVSIAPSFLQQE